LCGDKIFLGKNAYIGPTDPQLFFPASSIMNILNYDQPHNDLSLIYADMARKAIERTEKLLKYVLSRNYNSDITNHVVNDLNSGIYQHSQVFGYDDLKDYKLKIFEGVPPMVYKILNSL